jgi:hypothetical protein
MRPKGWASNAQSSAMKLKIEIEMTSPSENDIEYISEEIMTQVYILCNDFEDFNSKNNADIIIEKS